MKRLQRKKDTEREREKREEVTARVSHVPDRDRDRDRDQGRSLNTTQQFLEPQPNEVRNGEKRERNRERKGGMFWCKV